jgi:hypothetical protein
MVAFFKPCLDSTGVVMITYGLSKRLLKLSVIYNTAFAILMFLGIYWGAEGVALSNLAAVLLLFPFLYFSLEGTPVTVRGFFGAISTPMIGSVIMAGALVTIRGVVSQYGMVVSLCAGLGIAGAVYPIVVLLLPRGRREVIALASAVLGSLRPAAQSKIVLEETKEVSLA